MGCCGQQRAALVEGYAKASPKPSESGLTRNGSTVRLELTRRKALVVHGPITGRTYRFDEGAYVQPVDAKDAARLIMTGYFRQG
jgi:hypothetical protein